MTPFAIGDAFEKWGERMLLLVSYAVRSLAERQRYCVFPFGSPAAYQSPASQLVIGNQAKPTGESFGRRKPFNVISHIAEQAKNCGVTYARYLKKISFKMGKGKLPDVKRRRISINLLVI